VGGDATYRDEVVRKGKKKAVTARSTRSVRLPPPSVGKQGAGRRSVLKNKEELLARFAAGGKRTVTPPTSKKANRQVKRRGLIPQGLPRRCGKCLTTKPATAFPTPYSRNCKSCHLSRSVPTVSGGLPALGKRRR
jgi:hypothetical protein